MFIKEDSPFLCSCAWIVFLHVWNASSGRPTLECLIFLGVVRVQRQSLELEQIFFFLVCGCCVFVSLCKGVVVFLVIITGLVSYKGDVSGTGSAAIPTDGGCSKEPLRVMNVVGVMEAGALVHVHVHSSKGYCGSTRTGPRALHQLVRSKNSNTRCFVVFSLFSLRPGSNVELYRCRT